jgi:ADP-dependent glucokinase
VRAVNFLNYTEQLTQADFEDFNVDEITTNEEFLRSFAYYFRAGAASERFTPNQELFRYLVTLAKKHQVAEPRWALGGNAPVMGTRFYLEGADVLLAAKMSEKLKSHLQPEIRMIEDYSVDVDDIHLILEYQTGDKWGNLVAPRANRYILHNDQHNPRINSLEEFNKSLKAFSPRLFVVSGLQMLDNFPFEEPRDREDRLLKVREQMAQVDKTTFVHFEMASFVEIELLSFLIDNVIPYADSLGMNEQELDNLEQVLETGEISLVADSNPRVATALDQMRAVFVKLNKDHFDHQHVDANRRPLTRLHVHTLAYQAFMVVRTSQFKNTKNAAAKASLTAHRHVCATTSINPGNAHLILDDSFATSASNLHNTNAHHHKPPTRVNLLDSNPVACWNETISINPAKNIAFDVEICVAPVLVCSVARQTAGAGDNISAAGLILQI